MAVDLMDWNWWIAFQHPKDLWENQPSYLACEILYYFIGALTLIHAFRNGGRFPYLWLSIIFHGLVVESVTYFLPLIDNFWHSQTMVMLLGKRLPVHIIFFYPAFLYTSAVATSRMRLKRWAEPFMMGLGVVLLDVPFDIMGIKMVWWTWHDTDPNIYDRHYWVPWTSYYFHATFACSLNILFHGSRKLFTSTEGYKADSFWKEMICCLIPGLFSFPMGVLQFAPLYHPLHDHFGIHTEVCVLILIVTYALIVWSSDRHPPQEGRSSRNKGWFDEIGLQVLLHYTLYILVVIFAKPENVRSEGLHQTVGDCNAVSSQYSTTGQVQYKKTYLCAQNYDEAYFDWHCRKDGKPPENGSDWYLICGNPYPNHAEYITVVSAFCFVGLYIYYQILAHSGRTPSVEDSPKRKKQKAN